MLKYILFLIVSISVNAQTTKYNPFTKKLDYVGATGIGSGDITGGANAGAGTSVFYQKSGNTLQFNGVKSANNGIVVTLDAGTHDVTLTFTAGNVNLTDLAGNLAQSRITNLVSDLAAKDAVLTFSAPLSRSTNTISIPAANGSTNGYISSTDWTIFNNKVATSRQIICGSTLTGCGDFSADRTLGVVNDTNQQRVAVRKNSGAAVGTRQRINFIEGSNVTLTITDDGTDNEVDVTIASSSGGGSGSGTGINCAVTKSSNIITMAAGSGSTACGVSTGFLSRVLLAGDGTVTVTAGSGNVFTGFDFADSLYKAWHNVTATCNANITCVGSTTVIPVTAIYWAVIPVSSGTVGTVDDQRSAITSVRFKDSPSIIWTYDAFSGQHSAATLALMSPMTTRGDIIYQGASGAVRLAKGTSGQVLTMGADDPAWATPSGGGNSVDVGASRYWETQFTQYLSGDQTFGNNRLWISESDGGVGSVAMYDATSAYGGGMTFTTGTSSGNTRGIRATNTHHATEAGLNTAVTGTKIVFALRTGSDITTERIQARYLPGGVSRVDAEPGNAFGFMYDTANGTSGANWLIQNCTPSCSYTNTGVAVATSTDTQLELTKAASGWDWAVRTGSSFTVAASGNANITAPSVGMGPVINIVTTSAAARSFTAYRHAMYRKLY